MDIESSQYSPKTSVILSEKKTWGLDNDVRLLHRMEDISERLVTKSSGILQRIESLEKKLKVSGIEVKTISNNFEAVADNQFVEKRVYDEEEDLVNGSQEKNNDSPGSQHRKETVESAILRCSSILESKFEALNIPISDSEEDSEIDNKSEVIFVPKNKYRSRPLPHLIGGEDFYNDPTLGLWGKSDLHEGMSGFMMNGDEDTSSSESSSSIDEPDESSAAHDDHTTNKSIDNEVQSLLDSKEICDSLFHNRGNVWKNDTSKKSNEPFWKESDSPSLSESHDFPGENVQSSIQDELKKLFSDEKKQILFGDKKPKLNVFEKTLAKNVESSETSTSSDKSSLNSTGNDLIFEETKKTSRDGPVLQKFVHSASEKGVGREISTASTFISNESSYFKEVKKSTVRQDTILKDDGSLPNVATEVLHSFGKERARIKTKRRLPSRKSRSFENEPSNTNPVPTSKENLVRSPSTDEEDLFVLPQTSKKESPASSLFSKPSLFSPGSSIEDSNKSFLTGIKKDATKSLNHEKTEENRDIFDEPLGIFKAKTAVKEESINVAPKMASAQTEINKKKLFQDWDPFDSDDDLFSSLDKRKQQKPNTLFENASETPVKFPLANDEDLFFDELVSSSSSNLFSTSTSKKNNDSRKSSRLFDDGSDDESIEDIFSNSNNSPRRGGGASFLTNRKNIFAEYPTRNSSSQKQTENTVRQKTLSDPLLEPDDDLFD